MIVKMIKYSLVLYHRSYNHFLEQLREAGVVDITTTGWEPSDEQRGLINKIERHNIAVTKLEAIRESSGFVEQESFICGKEVFDQYMTATSQIETLSNQLVKETKELEAIRVWGKFSPITLNELKSEGIHLHFYSTFTRDFNEKSPIWSLEHHIERISDINGVTYFVIITDSDSDIAIDAQELKAPSSTVLVKEKEIEKINETIGDWQKVLERCASGIDLIQIHKGELMDRLNFERVSDSGVKEADDTLIILEGWATEESVPQVDKLLDAQSGLVYLKDRPTPDDNTPVLLKNNKFAKIFELIGGFYSLPKYGTLDLTVFFAPFYMIFFGFCLAEAGYGLMFILGGIGMLWKGGPSMNSMGKLAILCGLSATAFGFMTGSFFGIQLNEINSMHWFRDYFLTPEHLFNLALAIGVVQLLFGMVLKVIGRTITFGLKYALSTIGWIVVLVSTITAMLLPEGSKFVVGSLPYMIIVGVGLFLMLFCNNPKANIFVNLGGGLWNTYNDVVGFVGDTLSYIRLFAIGLSGGILAMVFNDLAFGLSPDIPVLKPIIIGLILIIGHGINLFMSSLGSFVHPMRLTFVEFYKNAGFEESTRAFSPFRKIIN